MMRRCGRGADARQRAGRRAAGGRCTATAAAAGTMPAVALGRAGQDAGRGGRPPSSPPPYPQLIARSEATTFCSAEAKTPPGILGGCWPKPGGRMPAEPSQDGRAREPRTLHIAVTGG